jgi:hypothetical protein
MDGPFRLPRPKTGQPVWAMLLLAKKRNDQTGPRGCSSSSGAGVCGAIDDTPALVRNE